MGKTSALVEVPIKARVGRPYNPAQAMQAQDDVINLHPDPKERVRASIRRGEISLREHVRETRRQQRAAFEGAGSVRDPMRHMPPRHQWIAEDLRRHALGNALPRFHEEIGAFDKFGQEMTGPEAFANQAQRGRIAWQRFFEPIECPKLRQQCWFVIVHRRSFSTAVRRLGARKESGLISIKQALYEGLDAAGIYLGVPA